MDDFYAMGRQTSRRVAVGKPLPPLVEARGLKRDTSALPPFKRKQNTEKFNYGIKSVIGPSALSQTEQHTTIETYYDLTPMKG